MLQSFFQFLIASLISSFISSLLCLHCFAQTVAVFEFDCDDKNFDDNINMMVDLLIHELVELGKGLGADYIILGALLQPWAVHYTLQHVWLI